MPPSECGNIDLYPKSHPSARHSRLNWTDIDINPLQKGHREQFYSSRAIETIVSAGEMLYIPSYWIHYIISQDASIQCNARCGESELGTTYSTTTTTTTTTTSTTATTTTITTSTTNSTTTTTTTTTATSTTSTTTSYTTTTTTSTTATATITTTNFTTSTTAYTTSTATTSTIA